MAPTVKILSLILLMVNSVWSQNWEAAYKDTEVKYDTLRGKNNELLEAYRSLQTAFDAKEIELTEANTKVVKLIQFRIDSKELNTTLRGIHAIIDSTEKVLRTNLTLHKKTAEEWEKLAKWVKDEYTDLVKQYSRTLWFMWEAWLGVGVGLIIGFILS